MEEKEEEAAISFPVLGVEGRSVETVDNLPVVTKMKRGFLRESSKKTQDALSSSYD